MKSISDASNYPQEHGQPDQAGETAGPSAGTDVTSESLEERSPVTWDEDGKCSWRDGADGDMVDVNEFLQGW